MATKSPLITVMTRAAIKAGRSLARDFGEVENLQVSRKGPADFVSAADTRTEDTLRVELAKARPKFGFLMEEAGAIPGQEPDKRWIIDPLDGTSNFLHSLPHFAISIAVEQFGEIIAGVVFNPVTDEMFWAEKNQGSYLNDRRLRVSSRKALGDSLIATGTPFKGHGDPERFCAEAARVIPEVAGIRRFGAAALDLAYVAAGRFDGFWEWGLKPWDTAAGLVLVREAGGFVSEIGGGKDPLYGPSVLAGTPQIHSGLGKLLTGTG